MTGNYSILYATLKRIKTKGTIPCHTQRYQINVPKQYQQQSVPEKQPQTVTVDRTSKGEEIFRNVWNVFEAVVVIVLAEKLIKILERLYCPILFVTTKRKQFNHFSRFNRNVNDKSFSVGNVSHSISSIDKQP